MQDVTDGHRGGRRGPHPAEIASKYTQAFLEDIGKIGIQPAHVYRGQPITSRRCSSSRSAWWTRVAPTRSGARSTTTSSPSRVREAVGNTLDQLRAGHRQEVEADPSKRFHADFALWKRAGAARLMKWTVLGEGFPGGTWSAPPCR